MGDSPVGTAGARRTGGGPTATPVRWRLAALGILVGGTGIGAAAAGGGGSRWLVLGSLIVVIGGLLPILVASRRPPIGPDPEPPPGTPLPMVTVIVAARDEAAVLPTLIRDIAAQDHRRPDGSPNFEILVVDDRSVDGSAAAVASAAAAIPLSDGVLRVIRRDGADLPDGKGAALTAAPPEICRGEMILVLDADARIGPTFLRRLARYAAAGVPAVTARRRILDAGSSHLAGAQADEQAQDGELQRGRWASGGCSEFRGNGIAIRRDLLAAVGGWRAAALTEDLDLSSRLAAARGVSVAWAIDLEVWEQPVRSWAGLWRQRLRWSEGALRRLFEHGAAVLSSPRLSIRARWDFAVYAAQLLAPPLIVGAVVGAAATGSATMAVALFATYLGAGGVLAFDALRWDVGADGRSPGLVARILRAARAAAFGAVWLAAVPGALWRLGTRRGPVRYDKMAHVSADPEGAEAGVAGAPQP